MVTRIALTFAGGASLGAYAAGAAHEILWALSHRTDPRRAVVIDVLTGASAGAVTAALVARALLGAPQGGLHRVWVVEMRLADLLEGPPRPSLFSDRALWELAHRHLLPRGSDPSEAPCPAAPPELRLTFALSNLNGISYGLGYSGRPGSFDTTVFSDRIAFRLGPGLGTGVQATELWRSIARAAIASSAFPLLFPTVTLERRLFEFDGSDAFEPQGTRRFTYSDGGLFNNEPVGLARQAVAELEEDHPQIWADGRIHILVDPHVASTAEVPEFPEEPLGIRLTLERLLTAVVGEASRRDWVRAVRTNRRLEWKETLVRLLAEVLVLAHRGGGQAIGDRLEALAEEIARSAGDQGMMALGPLPFGDDPALAAIREDPALTRLFLCAAYVVDSVAGLRDKVTLELHLVAPDRGSLAGDFLGNFGGLFKEEWREHDWRRGRADARAALLRMAGAHPELEYLPDLPEAYEPVRDLRGVGPGDVPRDQALILAAALGDRISTLLAPGRSGALARAAARAAGRYLGRKIVDRLLRSGSSRS